MKYQITLDNNENKNSPYILYDLRNEELVLENPELDLTINKVGKLSFSIYPEHPYFDRLEKKFSVISVIKNGKTIFRGRIVEDEQGLYNNKSVLCESSLAYLNDSIVRPSSFSGSPLEFLTMLLNNHNSQVSDRQKLLLGNVTVKDPNNYISRSWEGYLNSWEVLEKRGIELIGGYLVERYEGDGTYIDWLEDFDDTSTQVIEFGENIIDIFARNNANNTYSVAIPLGVETENEDGTKTRLTIESVNNGLDYIVNQNALNKYGWIVAPVSETTWDDVTLASNLKTKCENWLNNQGVMIESEFEITALDLQATNKNIESFFIYEYVRIKSEPHNINKVLLLSSIKIPLAHPENTQITVGESINTLTGIQLGNKQNIDNIINRVGNVEKDYLLNEQKISELEKTIEYFSVDLSQYNLTISTENNKIPLETKNYDISFYGYFKGQQVYPTVTIKGSDVGITTSSTSTYLRFSVSNVTAIENLSNEYEITFTYTIDGNTYTSMKKVNVVLALKGSDGTSVNILGSYNTLEELKAAHPTGNVGDAYIIQGNMYVWCADSNSWDNVGNIQGPSGKDGEAGKSAYEIWLDAGNAGTEQDYLASLKGEQGIQGATGKDGTSYYFYVRYSAYANGNPMTTAPTSTTKYMGVASTTSSTAPTAYSAYTWTLIKGDKGEQGIQGQTGADGKSSYLHIKYSDDGTTFTANNGETVGRYRGELVDNNSEDSTTFSDYTWYDMALIVDEELNEIRQEVINNTSLIEQTDTKIRLDVAEEYVSTGTFDEFRETTETQFTVQADGIEAKFSEMVLMVETVEGETQAQFRELASYIRGYQNEDGQPVLELGSITSDIILRQTNDRIQFIQNGTEVAYVSNNTLYITDGHFLNSLRIGQFAFIPRANGSLDFKKVTV